MAEGLREWTVWVCSECDMWGGPGFPSHLMTCSLEAPVVDVRVREVGVPPKAKAAAKAELVEALEEILYTQRADDARKIAERVLGK